MVFLADILSHSYFLGTNLEEEFKLKPYSGALNVNLCVLQFTKVKTEIYA